MTRVATLPPRHVALWVPARLRVRLAVSTNWYRGVPLHEQLAVVADRSTLVARVVEGFFGGDVIDRDHGAVTAVLIGEAMWRLARNIPVVERYVEEIASDAFALLTAPSEARPGLSAVRARTAPQNRRIIA